MPNSWIYPHYDEQLRAQNEQLDAEPHPERTKELIHRFQTHLMAELGTSQARAAKLTWGLRRLSTIIGQQLDLVTKKDLPLALQALLEQKTKQGLPLKPNTIRDYKRCVKQFYFWLEGEDDAPAEIREVCRYLRKNVKTPDPRPNHDPGNCLTEEDVSLVLNRGCRTPCERALLAFMFESGARVGETLNIRLCDIKEEPDLWVVRLNGKTGERPIGVIQSIPFILQWLAQHPDRQNPAAFLWLDKQHGPLKYQAARWLIRACFRRAGLQKRCNPHWWRHSRCTLDARDPNYTDSVLCRKMGHTLKVAARYRHMTANDVLDATRRSAGIQVVEDKKRRPLLPQQCRECLEVNPHDAKYCSKCGQALNIAVVKTEAAYQDLALKLQRIILSDPQLREEFERYEQTSGGAR